MGLMRAPSAMTMAALCGAGLAACASHPADRPDATRLQWLAHSLALELEAAGQDDPRVAAAADDLQFISAYAPSSATPGFAPAAWALAERLPELAGEPEEVTLPELVPLASLQSARLAQTAPPPEVAMGLTLGRFTDAGMAAVMWREIQGLDSAALTGLAGYTTRDEHGVALMAGPVADAQNAEERCMALTIWGLNCTPAAWPAAATAVTSP
jgi:hypothetical protein